MSHIICILLQESQESLVSHTYHQVTEKLNEFSLHCETRVSEDEAASSSVSVNSSHTQQQDSVASAAAVVMMPGISSSSSEDDEVAAINDGCEEPPPLLSNRQSIFTDSNSNGHDSPDDDLDLELIEQN